MKSKLTAEDMEVQPVRKRLKNAANPNERIYRIDGMFPAIDNLETFPTEILTPIFAGVDDVGLLRIASINRRFKAIAQVVFKQRYANKYFTVEGRTHQDLYWDMFRVFGGGIKAIEAIGLRNVDKSHWMARILHKHTKDLKKFTFQYCTFGNSTDFLSQHMCITHLTFAGLKFSGSLHIQLPEYHHLEKLRLFDFQNISAESLERTISNNPQLENLTLRDFQPFTYSETMRIVCKHLTHLKVLDMMDGYDFDTDIPSDSLIDEFGEALKHLEHLAIPVYARAVELLRCLCRNCKNIKHLNLRFMEENLNDEMVRDLRALDKIEELILEQHSYDEQIERFVEGLSHLNFLILEMETPRTYHYILSLLRKCPSVREIVIIQKFDLDEPTCFLNMRFYEEFVKIAEHSKARIELLVNDTVIAKVSKKEMVWRDKLMHWNGYEPKNSQSNLNLLDLANTPTASKMEKEDPFGVILNYLDLGSLYALSRANKRSEKLVESYVQRRSSQQETFIITDEFEIDYNGLRVFGPYVNNLVVILLRSGIEALRSTIDRYYENLRRLCLHAHTSIFPHQFIVPQVRHMVYYRHEDNQSYFRNFYEDDSCDLCEISRICPDLESLVLKTRVIFHATDDNNPHLFRNLKKLQFKPLDRLQMELVKNSFINTTTEIFIDN